MVGSVSCLTVGLLLFSLLGSSVVLELEPGAEVSPAWPPLELLGPLPPPSPAWLPSFILS